MNAKAQQSDYLLFEYPLKEHVRSFLRLEFLFKRYYRSVSDQRNDGHYLAIQTLLEILDILDRGDTRAELTKELARLSQSFSNFRKNPEVDQNKLDSFLKQIKQLYQWVLNHQGKLGDLLRQDPLLESIKGRFNIPGNGCFFDTANLFLFLNQSLKKKRQQLNHWIEPIKGVKTSIEVVLKIMRDSGEWQTQTAPMGSFLIESPEQPLQLLRVQTKKAENIFPEFSCGKHRSIIHFMQLNDNYKKVPQQKEIVFKLALCS